MKFILKNKYKLIILVILLATFISLGLFIKEIILSDRFGTLYGERLEGIEKYDINLKKVESITANFAAKNNISSIKASIHGKLINIIIYVKQTKLVDAKLVALELLKSFTVEEQEYFDIQVFLVGDDKTEYPKIGYKHESRTDLIWSN